MLSIKEHVLEYESTLGTYQSERISPKLEVDGTPTSLRIQQIETISSPQVKIMYNIPRSSWQDALNFNIQTKNPNFRLKFPLTVKQVKKFRQKSPRSVRRSVQYMKEAETVLTSCTESNLDKKHCVKISKVPENCKYCKSTGLTISKILPNFQ